MILIKGKDQIKTTYPLHHIPLHVPMNNEYAPEVLHGTYNGLQAKELAFNKPILLLMEEILHQLM